MRVAILNYHRIDVGQRILHLHRRAEIVVSLERFLYDLSTAIRKVRIVSLREALGALSLTSRPSRSLVLTFDDGFNEHFGMIADRLLDLRIPATMFVPGDVLLGRPVPRFIEVVGELEGMGVAVGGLARQLRGRSRSERDSALRHSCSDATLAAARERAWEHFARQEDVDAFARTDVGEIGAHSMGHPDLALLERDDLELEVLDSIRAVHEISLADDIPFAYPFGGVGSVTREVASVVAESGASCGLTSDPGLNSPSIDRFGLRRFDMCKTAIESVIDMLHEA